MKTKQTFKVIMLPSNKKAEKGNIVLNTPNNNLYIMDSRKNWGNYDTIHVKGSSFHEWDKAVLPQHLCIISDEEINDGDWVLFNNRIIVKYTSGPIVDSKKIVATTDKSLITKIYSHESQDLMKISVYKDKLLPQIPESFIEAYIKAYNEGKPITEVNLEMETETWGIEGIFTKIKTRPDNTVIIHPSKLYTRDEVINFILKFGKDNPLLRGCQITKLESDEFIKNNL